MLLLFQGSFRSLAFARNPNPRFRIPEPAMGKTLRRNILARRKEIHQQQYSFGGITAGPELGIDVAYGEGGRAKVLSTANRIGSNQQSQKYVLLAVAGSFHLASDQRCLFVTALRESRPGKSGRGARSADEGRRCPRA